MDEAVVEVAAVVVVSVILAGFIWHANFSHAWQAKPAFDSALSIILIAINIMRDVGLILTWLKAQV